MVMDSHNDSCGVGDGRFKLLNDANYWPIYESRDKLTINGNKILDIKSSRYDQVSLHDDNVETRKNGETLFCAIEKDRQQDIKHSQLRHKKCLLLLYIQCHLLSGINISMLAPFFPKEADKHGMPVMLISLTFSLFPTVNMIFCPVFGKHLNRIGSKFVLISGFVVTGLCLLLYGALEHCSSRKLFIVLSLLIRAVEGVGYSGYLTALLAVSASEFPNDASFVYALVSSSSEIGVMIGPIIGGALYTYGGFSLPFYVIGALILVNAGIFFFLLPSSTANENKKLSAWSLLLVPSTFAGILGIFVAGHGAYFIESTLAFHLTPLKLSPFTLSLFFLISPALFTISGPLYGYLVNNKHHQNILSLCGHAMFSMGFFMSGPATFFSFLNISTINIAIGLAFLGSSFCCCLITSNAIISKNAFDLGWGEDSETYGTVYGITNGVYFLGCTVGPLIGGSMFDEQYGYAVPYTVMGFIGVAIVILTFLLLFAPVKTVIKRCNDKHELI